VQAWKKLENHNFHFFLYDSQVWLSLEPKREDIDKAFLQRHKELESRYYIRHEITKEEFDRLHGLLWREHEAELIKHGYRKLIYIYYFLPDFQFRSESPLTSEEIRKLERKYKCRFYGILISSIEG